MAKPDTEEEDGEGELEMIWRVNLKRLLVFLSIEYLLIFFT